MLRIRIAAPFLALLVSASPAALAGSRIHVRGQAKVDAHAARSGGDLVLNGALVDDAGQPLPREVLAITVAHDPGSPVLFDDEHAARACSAAPRGPDAGAEASQAGQTLASKPEGPLSLTTDEAGRFCVRVALPRERYIAHVTWAGGQLIDGTTLDLKVDLARQALSISFDPEPTVLSLDALAVSLEAVAYVEENGITRAASLLPLQVTNERGDPLANDYTNASGRLRLTIPTSILGPPGRGELRLRFAGNTETGDAIHTAEIERHARVLVRVPLAESGELKPSAPEDGIALPILVGAKGGVVATGTIEARVGDTVVGAAPVEDGAARLIVTFATAAEAEVPLRVRYIPSAPWFEAGEELVIKLPVKGPSPWRQVPLAVTGLAVVVWLALGRVKRKAPRPAALAQKPAAKGEAKIEVVREAKSSKLGWNGRITDAHDGTPVEQARITIQRPGFERAEVIASAFANEAGHFELRAETRAGDELAIEAPFHSTLKQPLPPCGELEIALVLRKRRLLDRLVAWARFRGRPFDAHPEPTPGHVRRAAGEDLVTARWADAVERAAYGGGQVDARTEAEVERLAPAGHAGPAEPKKATPDATLKDLPPES